MSEATDDPRVRRPRVAVVTGGTRSIGAAISRRLVADGNTVVAVYRDRDDEAEALRSALPPEIEGRLTLLRADIREREECQRIVNETLDRHGRLDHLVNNASTLRDSRFVEMTAEEWDDVLRVGLSAVFHLTQAALVPMRAAGYGRIVQISSIAGQMGAMRQANYAAAKAGLVGLTRTVAREVARDGITANIVMPGPTADTQMNELTPADVTASLCRLIPLQRLADAADTAHAVSFLLDDRSSYITGVVLPVDGGFSM